MIPAPTILEFKDASALNGGSKDILLFEVPTTLADQIESEEQFSIKGQDNEQVVLTTLTESYLVRYAETSNSLLLVDEQVLSDNSDIQPSVAFKCKFGTVIPDYKSTVIDSGHSFYELVPVPPRFDSVSDLLPIYTGPSSISEQSISFDQLLHVIPASKVQLEKYLKTIHVVDIQNRLFKVDIQYIAYVLELVLLTIQEQNELTMSLTMEDTDVPIEITKHVLEYHTIYEKEQLILDERKVCRTLGHSMLKKHQVTEYTLFLDEWQKSCLDITINISYLDGLYLLELGRPTMIKYFYLNSSDPKTRLQELFKTRPKWRRDDIIPFLTDLVPNRKELNVLLLKYTRESKQDQESFLTFKYAVF